MMMKLRESGLICGGISKVTRDEISKEKLMTYLMRKNPHWTETISGTMDWDTIFFCMSKISPTRVTNVLKLVHDYQNDGYQKYLFYGISEECKCPIGYGKLESRLYFFSVYPL